MHLGGNLYRVIGTYMAFIWPTMEYALEICMSNASSVKVLECCHGDMLYTMLGVSKSTSYAAILLLRKVETIEHRRHAKVSCYIHHHQLDSVEGLLDMEHIAQKKKGRLIPRLCQEVCCAGPPHRITTTISKRTQACL
ncbi:hypothetical protein IW146_008745 [Coemansia sp. RSA 922]|nr:hypothetical protein GGH13_005831 [Coemansia sp. S155-1]KAJ2103990.1 hypothetical protein IW146_008745 [Coemansia sp. RSA 922]